jgi:transcriptional regulator with XRE-family HTH domain
MSESGFTRFIKHHRETRSWSIAELARRAGLTQPEISRLESGVRTPTLRHVRGLAEAFSSAPVTQGSEPKNHEGWASLLVDLGERARVDARSKSKSPD